MKLSRFHGKTPALALAGKGRGSHGENAMSTVYFKPFLKSCQAPSSSVARPHGFLTGLRHFLTVQDLRTRFGFIELLPIFDPSPAQLLGGLVSYADWQRRKHYRNPATIRKPVNYLCKCCGLTRRTLQRYLHPLETRKLITVYRPSGCFLTIDVHLDRYRELRENHRYYCLPKFTFSWEWATPTDRLVYSYYLLRCHPQDSDFEFCRDTPATVARKLRISRMQVYRSDKALEEHRQIDIIKGNGRLVSVLTPYRPEVLTDPHIMRIELAGSAPVCTARCADCDNKQCNENPCNNLAQPL